LQIFIPVIFKVHPDILCEEVTGGVRSIFDLYGGIKRILIYPSPMVIETYQSPSITPVFPFLVRKVNIIFTAGWKAFTQKPIFDRTSPIEDRTQG